MLVLLDAAFRQELAAFLIGFESLRQQEEKRLLDTAIYEFLPCAPQLQNNPEWRMRCYDLAIVTKLLAGRKAQNILEIGAWNGWLSNRLAKMGHHVIAIDYFTDAYDGLAAKKHYHMNWQAIQMDLTDLSVLSCQFDVIIVNRCLPFFANPVAYALAVKEKVTLDGLLLLTGLSFFQNPATKAASVAYNRAYLQTHGLDHFRPLKGYLDFTDKARLEAAKIQLRPYPQLWRANLKSWFKQSAPRYFYGVYPGDWTR